MPLPDGDEGFRIKQYREGQAGQTAIDHAYANTVQVTLEWLRVCRRTSHLESIEKGNRKDNYNPIT